MQNFGSIAEPFACICVKIMYEVSNTMLKNAMDEMKLGCVLRWLAKDVHRPVGDGVAAADGDGARMRW